MDSNQVLEWIKTFPLSWKWSPLFTVDEGDQKLMYMRKILPTQWYCTTFLVMGFVLLYPLEIRELLTSLYGMLTVQKWCRLQVAPEHLGGFLLDL
jgi:hypothetical protein